MFDIEEERKLLKNMILYPFCHNFKQHKLPGSCYPRGDYDQSNNKSVCIETFNRFLVLKYIQLLVVLMLVGPCPVNGTACDDGSDSPWLEKKSRIFYLAMLISRNRVLFKVHITNSCVKSAYTCDE